MRELFIGQQRSDRRDARLGADQAQHAAGELLRGIARFRLSEHDEHVLLDGGALDSVADARGILDSGQRRAWLVEIVGENIREVIVGGADQAGHGQHQRGDQ